MQLVHGDDVDVPRAKVRQHRAQEFRRDLKMTVRLERGIPSRADMVQREDGADAGEDRPKQMMRAREVKRPQSGADDVVAKLLHQGGWPVGRDSEASGPPLKKRLAGRLLITVPSRVISGLTALQGFVFSLFPVADLMFPQRLRAFESGTSNRKEALKSSLCPRPALLPKFVSGVPQLFTNFGKRGARPRGTSNARTFQVEQQMVAGCHSAICLMGAGGLD